MSDQLQTTMGEGLVPVETGSSRGQETMPRQNIGDNLVNENLSKQSLSMSQLQGLPGFKMLQYIQSDQFGQYGESNKLYDII